jgi:hypothetical protein
MVRRNEIDVDPTPRKLVELEIAACGKASLKLTVRGFAGRSFRMGSVDTAALSLDGRRTNGRK